MRSKYLFILAFFLIIPGLLALDVSLSKTSYQPQETLQAEITGNFINPLTIENIFLYKEGVPRPTPVISDLAKFKNTYYVYLVLPNQEGNFSIRIENAKYTEAGMEKTDTIIKEFEIKKTNQSVLQINPGFVITDKDFSIKVKSLYSNQDISLIFNGETKNISLIEDSEESVKFSVINAGEENILKVNDYEIPVFIFSKQNINITENQTTEIKTNLTIISNMH